jgi:hypothetical protein
MIELNGIEEKEAAQGINGGGREERTNDGWLVKSTAGQWSTIVCGRERMESMRHAQVSMYINTHKCGFTHDVQNTSD